MWQGSVICLLRKRFNCKPSPNGMTKNCISTILLASLYEWCNTSIIPSGPGACVSKKLFYVCRVSIQDQSFNNFKNDNMKMPVNKPKSSGLWARNCATGRFLFNLKFRKFRLVHQMERTISVWSDRNIRDQLWRWSSVTGLVISVGRTEMCLSICQNCCPQYRSFVSCLQEQVVSNGKSSTVSKAMTSQIRFESVAIFFDFWYLPALTVSNNWHNTTRS